MDVASCAQHVAPVEDCRRWSRHQNEEEEEEVIIVEPVTVPVQDNLGKMKHFDEHICGFRFVVHTHTQS